MNVDASLSCGRCHGDLQSVTSLSGRHKDHEEGTACADGHPTALGNDAIDEPDLHVNAQVDVALPAVWECLDGSLRVVRAGSADVIRSFARREVDRPRSERADCAILALRAVSASAMSRPQHEGSMETVDEKVLKARLDRGERLTLVMFMDREAFDRAHIPGSLQCKDAKEAMERFPQDEPIVGYCSTDACIYSKRVCATLFEHGWSRVIHFNGGLWAWEQAGYPLEGTMIRPQ